MIDALKLRFGMLGAGAIAQTYVRAFARSSAARLVAIADTNREAATALAAKAGCAGFGSHEELAVGSECDAVLVCTPPSTHPEICNWFLRRGLHVLCEKPLAIDSESAVQMLEAARDGGAHLTMASKFRYATDVVRARALVQQGIVGEVVLFENTFTSYVDMTQRWNSHPPTSGGGVLIDNGTHSVDIIRYFLGPIADLQVIEGKRLQALPVEDTVRVFARTVDGVMASVDLSWSIHKISPSYICIYGSAGTLQVGWQESKYRLQGDTEWTVFGHGYDKLQAFSSQLDNVARAIRGEEPFVIESADALASVNVIEAAYQSLCRNGWRRVDRPAQSRPTNRLAPAPLARTSR
ncbi:MAG: Gfo/Idh/MocA family oxidoreductase [Pirellulales bacterium]|nr:Gfo/Idh/MocA family oxidoreductase [Pirellulales bacterium]